MNGSAGGGHFGNGVVALVDHPDVGTHGGEPDRLAEVEPAAGHVPDERAGTRIDLRQRVAGEVRYPDVAVTGGQVERPVQAVRGTGEYPSPAGWASTVPTTVS